MTNEELQSKTIDFLRFPLIVGVVLIHAHITGMTIKGNDVLRGNSFPVCDTISYFFSEVVARMAVPLFFFISGFLFFYKIRGFSLSVYATKLKGRIRSILIPYLFWNLVVILFFFLAQTFLPGLMSGANKLIRDYSYTDWLAAFWSVGGEGGYPICYQFWFLRDLMVVMLFSPLLYMTVKYFRWSGVFVLGVLWYFNWWFSLVGFSITAFFFFSAGACFSVLHCNFVTLFKSYLFPLSVAYALSVFICVWFREKFWIDYVSPLAILAGIAFVISLSARFLERGKWSVTTFLVGGTFFVYAFHGMPLAFIQKFVIKHIPTLTDALLLSIYFLSAGFIILLSLGIYYFLKRLFPRFLSIITGGR